jgi:hypothetical protein
MHKLSGDASNLRSVQRRVWDSGICSEVNGVEYKYWNEMNKVAEAIGMNGASEVEVKRLAYRKFLEMKRDILTRITEFGACDFSIISVPNSVEEIQDKCFFECRSLFVEDWKIFRQ